MKHLKQMPIKRKLVLISVFSSVIGILLVSLGVIGYENYIYKKRLQQELTIIVSMLADRSNAALVFRDTKLLQDNLISLKLHESIELACVYDAQDVVVSFYQRQPSGVCPSAPDEGEGVFSATRFKLTQAIHLDGQRIGRLHLSANLKALRQHLQNYVITMFAVAGMVCVAIILLSNFLQSIISRPLLLLSDTVQKITEKRDFSLRAEKMSDDEIGQLVTAFNGMIQTIETQNAEINNSHDNLEKMVEQRTSELQEANRELEAFSYSVSHDLRQPLRAIDGFSLAILEDCGEMLDETGKGYLSRVRAASQRMGMLIDGMLNLSRVTRHEMQIENVDIAALTTDILSELQDQAPGRIVKIEVQTDMIIKGDERMLRIVLTNLLENAWKYTARTEAACVWVGTQLDDSGEKVYYVRDNGAGFEMRYADKLFHAFHRMHPVQEFEGTGIGLATVYRVIKRHGGKIWAEAKVNGGSTFYFTVGL